MPLDLLTADELDAPTLAAWRALRAANPALASPCFTPGFARAVAAARPDLRIGVLHEGGRITALWPHQNDRGRGAPAGGSLSDHHGLVCAPGLRCDWPALLRAAGLAWWAFDHLPAAQAPPGAGRTASPALDLAQGYAAWRQRRREAGASRLAQLERKARKLAREVGPLRFEAHTTDRRVFDTVLRLKSRQCRRTGVPDFFAWPWARALAQAAWQAQEEDFAGRLSALYAGDQLVAAHLGLRSPQAWHWWFPVYEAAHAAHSPGALLLLEVARAAAAGGCAMLDLGQGDDAYKASFADTALPLATGWVARPSLASLAQGARRAARAWWRGSGALQPLRALARPVMRRARAIAAASRT
ncbi:GNAT family N-acetyltransferase [Ramlibacter sp. MAHUQ-53]|uniref:GNAT family N-acetyltransferase n=1 Tax=unclassified Ramlibacter TaxID=2617605 RepID=UPI0036284E7A